MQADPESSDLNSARRSMTPSLPDRVTCGDSGAAANLLPLVYDQLRAIAGAYFQDQSDSHTLQPTALVHEAFLKLASSDATWKSQAHFCAVAATAMRQVLIDHFRSKGRAKRAGVMLEVTMNNLVAPASLSLLDLVALDNALTRLASRSERSARLVELRFFGGMNTADISEVLGVSPATVERDWRHVRAWLSRELGGENRS